MRNGTKGSGRGWMRWGAVTVIGLSLGLSIACNNNDDPTSNPTGGGSTLTVVNATPSDGNGAITVAGTFTLNNGGTGFDELNFSETGHDVTIVWDTSTHALHSASHGWGSGYTQCVMGTANPCDTSKVAIDFAGQTVTFTGLVLVDDTFGTSATSTLTGAGHW
jgi:hypothetical protein